MTASRLKDTYKTDLIPALRERFEYSNAMQVPKLEKIVVNAGVGEAVQEPKALENVLAELTAITGQKPAIRRAKKAISNFKLREGMPIGAMVTLRQDRMFEFLDRLVNFTLPQVRDFRGVPARGFDGRGNYNLGIREQIIFPEIDYDRIDKIRGMNITFVTTAKTDEEAKELLRLFGVPFSN
ncbi:MAG: 50S ribosomal protein L5 [Gemmatimonadetes bacterium]|jgi:large subunit ribosomal protein L5|nr:50S ribosomal protein L5 [Gemmatimonadota bacterium]MBT7351786.1 50S ribosomal protein L5 [Phycisphaerae bacterium]MBT5055651.1 50S ribosomal protein L5 [Gemmatimonadota bacterium]MBT5143814.1 50S ribosomal protein L5 [Gemmatimonadota bacterium]MBT5590581.1 50S ribosomal protein L5 [Gemmatimonadota bacterium]